MLIGMELIVFMMKELAKACPQPETAQAIIDKLEDKGNKERACLIFQDIGIDVKLPD